MRMKALAAAFLLCACAIAHAYQEGPEFGEATPEGRALTLMRRLGLDGQAKVMEVKGEEPMTGGIRVQLPGEGLGRLGLDDDEHILAGEKVAGREGMRMVVALHEICHAHLFWMSRDRSSLPDAPACGKRAEDEIACDALAVMVAREGGEEKPAEGLREFRRSFLKQIKTLRRTGLEEIAKKDLKVDPQALAVIDTAIKESEARLEAMDLALSSPPGGGFSRAKGIVEKVVKTHCQ
jgi:hypothetical protein